MTRFAIAVLAAFGLAGSAAAQTMDHTSMPGMVMPTNPSMG